MFACVEFRPEATACPSWLSQVLLNTPRAKDIVVLTWKIVQQHLLSHTKSCLARLRPAIPRSSTFHYTLTVRKQGGATINLVPLLCDTDIYVDAGSVLEQLFVIKALPPLTSTSASESSMLAACMARYHPTSFRGQV